jgi:hypothetical protein
MVEITQSVNWEHLVGLVFFIATVIGSILFTALTIRATRGPLERRFMARASIGAWVTILLFFMAVYLIPPPWRYWLLIPYFLHLPVAIYVTSKKQLLIRQLEERASGADETPKPTETAM